MLLNLILTAVYGLLGIFVAVDLPTFPADFMGYIDTFISYLETGVKILGNYIDLPYLIMLFEIFVALWLAFELYKFVMWFLRKVPFISVK